MVSASLALPPARGLLPLPLSVLAVPRREKPRSSRPRVPEDFFSAEAQALLADLLARRAAAWQADDTAPLYFYGQHSAPLWGEEAAQRCSGRRLRAAKRWALCESLSLELERGLRGDVE